MKKSISVLLLLLYAISLALSLASCTPSAGEKEYPTRSKTISYTHFNTVSILSSYGDTTEEQLAHYVQTADELLGYYHKLFDIYYEYAGVNNLRTVNRCAGVRPVEVDEELIDFLLYCKELYALTGGKTNVMLGSVLCIWHDARELADEQGGLLNEEMLPDQEELTAAAEHVSIDLLVIDKEAKTVYISDPLASIDVGAIAKGYAATKLAEKLKAEGADAIAVNAGGNIVTVGAKPDGSAWVAGIKNPDRTAENNLICRVEIGSDALVTSGDYERYFVSGGRKYHHIIDPATLMPAEYFSSVSIFTQNGALADALSTALFCMSYEDGLALVQGMDGVDVLWIGRDGSMRYTSGIKILP